MPRVRRYGAQGQVEQRPLPNIQLVQTATPDQFGAGVGETLGRIGSVFARQMIREERAAADDFAITDARGKLELLYNNLLVESGQTQGKEALQQRDAIQKRFTTGADEIANGLSNDNQRNEVLRSRVEAENRLNVAMMRHEFAETQRMQVEAKAALRDGLSLNAIANTNDLYTAGKLKAQAVKASGEWAALSGAGAQGVANAQFATASQINVGIINQLLAQGDDVHAKMYLEEIAFRMNPETGERELDPNQRELLPQDLERATANTQRGSRIGQAQRATEAIMAEHPQSEWLAVARATLEGVEEEDVIQHLKIRMDEIKKAEIESLEEAMGRAVQHINAGGTPDTIPPDDFNRFPITFQNQLRATFANLHTVEVAGGDKGETPQYFDQLRLLAQNQEAFARPENNLWILADKMGWTQLQRLLSAQEEIRSGQPKSAGLQEMIDSGQTDTSIIRDIVVGAAVAADSVEGSNLSLVLWEAVGIGKRQAAAAGTPWTSEDTRKTAQRVMHSTLFEQGNTIPFLRPFFDTEPESIRSLIYKDLSQKTVNDTTAALRQEGIDPSEENILFYARMAYMRELMKRPR